MSKMKIELYLATGNSIQENTVIINDAIRTRQMNGRLVIFCESAIPKLSRFQVNELTRPEEKEFCYSMAYTSIQDMYQSIIQTRPEKPKEDTKIVDGPVIDALNTAVKLKVLSRGAAGKIGAIAGELKMTDSILTLLNSMNASEWSEWNGMGARNMTQLKDLYRNYGLKLVESAK